MVCRRRNCSVAIRVSEAERDYLEARRAQAKLPMREFIFECLRRKPFVVKPGSSEVIVQLKRIGNNLNQLTRNVNAGRITDCRDELAGIRKEIAEIRAAWQ